MSRATAIVASIGLLALSLVLASPSVARDDGFKLIVNPANPVTTLDRTFVRAAFLREVLSWKWGAPVHPIALPSSTTTSVHFAEEILKKSVPQLRSYWVQRIFSGKGTPPPELESTAAVVTRVLADPGAVAYIPEETDPGAAKVVEVR
jgi:ABC-type phosphate transport system substrate-binding protein